MSERRELIDAVEWATRAPSVHNTQPWRWVIRDDAVELHADWSSHLIATDPDRRDLVLSCGAALHHLQVALAAHDRSVHVQRCPDPENQEHLATITIRSGTGDAVEAAMFAAIARRRTDRRRMSDRRVSAGDLRTLVDQAARRDVVALPLTDPAMRERVHALISAAAGEQARTPGYAAELYIWTHRYARGHDGIPRRNIPASSAPMVAPSPLRAIPPGILDEAHRPAGDPLEDRAELLLLATDTDELTDRLRAGEALSAVLLSATRLGLATTPLSQAMEVPDARLALRQQIVGRAAEPQLIVRVGWPVDTAGELPATPRKSARSVVIRDPG